MADRETHGEGTGRTDGTQLQEASDKARIDGPIVDKAHLEPPLGADLRAQAALASSSVVDLRELTVCCEGEDLLISGRVHCFYHKQLAQETVRQHAADLRLVNQVFVERF